MGGHRLLGSPLLLFVSHDVYWGSQATRARWTTVLIFVLHCRRHKLIVSGCATQLPTGEIPTSTGSRDAFEFWSAIKLLAIPILWYTGRYESCVILLPWELRNQFDREWSFHYEWIIDHTLWLNWPWFKSETCSSWHAANLIHVTWRIQQGP